MIFYLFTMVKPFSDFNPSHVKFEYEQNKFREISIPI